MAASKPRATVTERAGTVMTDGIPVYGTAAKRRQHGLMDPYQRVFQCGGELGNFVYWKERLLTLDADVYATVRDHVDTLEWVDHGRNEVYVVTMAEASAWGREYGDKIGRRWGVPLNRAIRKDAAGNII